MRRIFVLLVALAMFLALPLASASAQEERFEASIHASGEQVGVTDDGGNVAEGVFEVIQDGAVVETGVMRSVTYPAGDGAVVRYFTTYVDDSTGNVVTSFGKVVLVAADPATGMFTYAGTERILSSTTGVMGHARGSVDIQLRPDGTFAFDGMNHWILNF